MTRTRWGRLARIAAVAGTALTLVGIGTPALAAAERQVYVAMGDSFSAGSVVLPQSDLLTCARSAINYAGLLAKQLEVDELRDVTCAAATTAHFTNPQKGVISGTNPPQYDALSTDTTLVTVGIGGNDIGLVGLATSCVNLLPGGASCKAANTAGGVDKYATKIDAFAATYGTVIEQIRQRAP
ncbi:MAG TPA: GDSL-type esterase/lipase family protein, partial [Amycolatopsis sp.]|nr:GDSL-type esterase/lipase family protein [Amycolatopsis sp.]